MDLQIPGEFVEGHNYATLFAQAPSPIAILRGREMRYAFINHAYASIFPGRQILGKTVLEAFPELEDQPYMQLLQEVFDTGTPFNGNEVPAIVDVNNDGNLQTRYFNLLYTPYSDTQGRILGLMAFGNDVTDQVRAKQRIAQSENNLRNMVLQAPAAMCVLKGPTHVVEIANQSMYELWGKTEEELLGRPIFEGLHEAKEQGYEALLDSVFFSGEQIKASESLVMLPRNGTMQTTYVNFVYQPLREADGQITGVIVVATDVSEQVQARMKIAYAEESARLAIELAGLGAYDVDLKTDVVTTNARFNAIWDIEDTTSSRADLARLIYADDVKIRQHAHREALKTGNLEYETRITRKDGDLRWIKVKGKMLVDQHGEPVRLLGVIQDITEQKFFAQQLSAKVDERTHALKEANERLERSNDDLEQFAYIASHDLQEPIRKIQLFNDFILKEANLSSETIRYIEKSNRAAKRMSHLIKDMLQYSLLSHENPAFHPTDLNVIVADVMSDLECIIEQAKGQIQFSHLPVIEAIPVQINQLMLNLISNAIKFSRTEEPPVIHIQSEKLPRETVQLMQRLNPEKSYYEIKIADNGIGFDRDSADKIFTIFHRLNEKNRYGGHGIGLAICRKIVSNHAGLIYAESRSKHGACFRIILPEKQ